MPPDKDTQWPEVKVSGNGSRINQWTTYVSVRGHGTIPKGTERYLPISSIKERLLSDEAVETLASEIEEHAATCVPRDAAKEHLTAAFDQAFPDTKGESTDE